MDAQIGNIVEVRRYQGKRSSPRDSLICQGEVIFRSKKFAVIEFDSFRESFWLDEIFPLGTLEATDQSKSKKNSGKTTKQTEIVPLS